MKRLIIIIIFLASLLACDSQTDRKAREFAKDTYTRSKMMTYHFEWLSLGTYNVVYTVREDPIFLIRKQMKFRKMEIEYLITSKNPTNRAIGNVLLNNYNECVFHRE